MATKDALAVERELHEEKANALALAAERLERSLVELDEARRASDAAAGAQRLELAERYRERRAHAAERLWFLLVQREAIGLTQHDNVLAFYRVPPELRKVAGPRPRGM